jgi:hypothetical protein
MTSRREEPPLPPYMQHLPRDHRKFIVPWFVPKIDGEWNFQVIRPGRVATAVRTGCCWICGGQLRKNLAFVLGGMCIVNRTSSEPPSHVECATYGVQVCPFLSRPRMRRAPIDEEMKDATPGIMLERNPGVAVLWVVRRFDTIRSGGGLLFKIREPTVRLSCWAEGRKATEEEIEHSFVTGLPALEKLAREDDEHNGNQAASEELARRIVEARKMLGLREAATRPPGSPPAAR